MSIHTIEISSADGEATTFTTALFEAVALSSDVALGVAVTRWYHDGFCSLNECRAILGTWVPAKVLPRPDTMPNSTIWHTLNLRAMQNCVVVHVPTEIAWRLKCMGRILPIKCTVIPNDGTDGKIEVSSYAG
jgi:hypothetical protein